MNDPEFDITFDFEHEAAVTPSEMQLLADLLPELIKDLLWLQHDNEA